MTRRASDIEKVKLQRLDQNAKLLDGIHDCMVEAKNILFADGELDQVGMLLNDSWLIKRELSGEVTNQFVDEIYIRALGAGALGGKLLGAGGGGFLLFYVPKKSQSRFREAMNGLHEVKFSLNAQGSSVIHVGTQTSI
jgi:D-glycero-alpha-D-manno-heptose-7-phosphate kinase